MRPFFILLSVVALLSCVERRTTDPYINGATRVINIPEDYEQNICSDALFESVDLVPLETTEECLIGRVDRLLICDSLYLINDTRQRVLVFDRTGKFRYQIGKRGGAPNEYLEVRDF